MKRSVRRCALSFFILIGIMISPFCLVYADEARSAGIAHYSEQGYHAVASTDDLTLYFNAETTGFRIQNNHSGYVWISSLPETGKTEDEDRSFFYKTQSLFLVDYYDVEKNNEDYVSAFLDSVDSGTFSVEEIQNGVKIIFDFSYPKMQIPLCLTLTEKGFCADIPIGEIQYDYDTLKILSISLLPYFGAAELDDEGYAFLPDGCGGLVYFDKERTDTMPYEKSIYGADLTCEPEESSDISMPVFGLNRGSDLFLATVTDSAAECDICCNGYTELEPYTNVYAKYNALSKVNFELVEQNGIVAYETGRMKAKHFSVTYMFADHKNDGYVSMAKMLQKELFGDRKTPITPTLYLDLYASVKKMKSFWGLRYHYNCTLTSLSDVTRITNALKEKGAETQTVRYSNFDKRDISGKIVNRFSWNRSLGNHQSAKIKELKENGIQFYYGYENNLQYFSNANPLHTLTDAARDPADTLVSFRKKGDADSEEASNVGYSLNAKKMKKVFRSFSKSLQKQDVASVAFSDIGNTLYSDFRYNAAKRTEQCKTVSDFLSGLSKRGKAIMLENPNYYAARYANCIFSLPTESSGHDLLDEDVPFLQILYSGFVNYSCPSINLSGNTQKSFLKALETGSMPSFSLIGRDTALLKNTDLEYLYSANDKDWIDTAAEMYKAVSDVIHKTEGTAIKNRKVLKDGLVATVYENGMAVVVNYNAKDCILANGTIVKGMNYVTEKEGQI